MSQPRDDARQRRARDHATPWKSRDRAADAKQARHAEAEAALVSASGGRQREAQDCINSGPA
eukprot:2987649-Rhodomonas_salina.1